MVLSNYSVIRPQSFLEYKNLISNMAAFGICSGDQSEERIEATKINAQRTKRIHNTFTPSLATIDLVKKMHYGWEWIVLTETWCGDGAQNLPIIAKIAELNPLIHLVVGFRDMNKEIMDQHLTSGTRAIPKLICLNATTKEFIGEWGPRPESIIKWVKDFKENNPNGSHDEFVKNLHLVYAKDKGVSMENELLKLMKKWLLIQPII